MKNSKKSKKLSFKRLDVNCFLGQNTGFYYIYPLLECGFHSVCAFSVCFGCRFDFQSLKGNCQVTRGPTSTLEVSFKIMIYYIHTDA